MKICALKTKDAGYVRAVAEKVMQTYDGCGIEWKHPVDDPELWKLNSGQRAGVVGVKLGGRRCCVKLFYDDRMRAKARNLCGLSKAKRAFASALKLKARQVACPEMIGWVRVRAGGPYMVVSELCDYAHRTDHYIREHGIDLDLVRLFAGFVRNMHGKGIGHVDFSLRNTMVVVSDRAPRFRFLLLDYEDARFGSALSRGKRLNNLHHLLERALPLVPLKWRVVFLREYLQTENIREWVYALNRLLKKYPSKYTDHLSV